MNITLYIGPSGVKKAADFGADQTPRYLYIPLLSGMAEFERRGRSYTWTGKRGGAKEVAIVDWLHRHKIGFTYDCVPDRKTT